MGAEDNGDFVLNFLQINNLKIEDDPNAVIDRLDLIKQKIDGINHLLSTCVQNLRIKDKNGDILFSADPKDIIIKKLENETRIIPAKNLREIQEHLEKITKKRSQDEFQSRQGKLNDKSLTYFSKQEKQTLNEIEKMINPMHAYIQKQLSYVQSDLRESLEELKRIIGLNSGHYWVNQEGSSGLFSEEKIRVLEYMTGRPHYISKNAQNAIETIKQGPYSAISSSSVFHTKPGMHAQYIADIEPVEVNVKKADGTITKETKEILFQDNTWGPSELENTWIDSNGLKRTDYSDNRGGSLGYITNEKLRNGNFVDRILNEMVVTSTPDTTNSKVYKKIKHPSAEGYHFPQYGDFILDGKSPEIKKITDQLHDTLFIPKTKDLTTLSQLVEDKYTTEEIKAFLANINGVNKNWEDKFDTLYKRIFPPFGPGIKTKEDYENLADDDYLKIVLEKMALKKNYQISGLEPELTKIKNLKDLAKFKAAQKNRAINSFKYAFGKNSYNIVDYVTQAFTPEDDIKITTILKKYNPEISDEQLDTIGSHFSIDLDRFDGSVKTTINLLMETLSKDIRNVLTNPEGIREAEKFFSDFLHRSLYFNSSDLKNGKIRHIVNFIDREFNPNDDKEFVKIYRQIQDMTHSEFKEQIISKTKAKDFGINNLTGFDMLKKIRLGNEDYEYSFKNEIATDGLYADLPTKNYKYSYRLNKLSRTISLQKNETLPFIYRNLYFDLSVLSLPKIFNQYKDRNLNKYGVFPAYPKLNYITEETVSTSFNALNSLMKEDITTIKAISEQIKNYQISNNLKDL